MENEPANGDVQPRDPEQKQRKQRLAWLIFGLGISALVLGGFQLRSNLKQPFTVAGRAQLQRDTQPQNTELLALQAKDTDKDGLTDYDELYSYNTSPYIADSDSDGQTDKQEVDSNTNPNCPAGQTCGVISNTNAAAGNETTNTAPVAGTSTVTPQQLREALLAAGVSQAEVDAIDDATLLKNYQDVVASEATNTNTTANANTATATNSSLTVDQLKNLTIPEIREFLKSGGVDETTLNSYDDATLRAVYDQALQEALKENTNTNGS
ncbi:MAG: hypothetical protein AAB445_00065 [Patescibacteria group bacterium]